jgi:hypothetical protein
VIVEKLSHVKWADLVSPIPDYVESARTEEKSCLHKVHEHRASGHVDQREMAAEQDALDRITDLKARLRELIPLKELRTYVLKTFASILFRGDRHDKLIWIFNGAADSGKSALLQVNAWVSESLRAHTHT